MDLRRAVSAAVVGFVVVGVASHLIRSVWLIPLHSHYELIWALRAHDVPHRWGLWLGQLLFIIAFIWIYSRGVENKPWASQGIRYGLMMSLLAVIPAACTQSVLYPVPYVVLAKWIFAGSVQLLLLALVVAACYRKGAADPTAVPQTTSRNP